MQDLQRQNDSLLARVLREDADILTNLDRVVLAVYFLQEDGRTAITTQAVAAALKAAGQPDVRRLGPSYGQAAAQGLIAQGNIGYRITPLGREWAEEWMGPLTADSVGDHLP